jgi:hypothetical protein
MPSATIVDVVGGDSIEHCTCPTSAQSSSAAMHQLFTQEICLRKKILTGARLKIRNFLK